MCIRDSQYGIRIENLVVVKQSAIDGMLEFETLTLAPIDRSLIDTSLLTDAEIRWVDQYHKQIWETLSPLLNESDAIWLLEATTPLESD